MFKSCHTWGEKQFPSLEKQWNIFLILVLIYLERTELCVPVGLKTRTEEEDSAEVHKESQDRRHKELDDGEIN